MNQKLETSQRPTPPAADSQHAGGPHFELNHESTDSCHDHSTCAGTPSNQPQSVSTQSIQNEQVRNDAPEVITASVLVTVLMPCLNEARTLAACIQQAHAGCQTALSTRNISRHALASGSGHTSLQSNDDASSTTSEDQYNYEILIADNGSTDGSPEIAIANGARVVHVAEKGYGAALRGGIGAARGKYIVMGDSDFSYDFGEVPRFLDKLEEGYDLVLGNRFAGGIMPGAMPWHHRYIGNPILSGIGRLLYRTPIRDWHCGLRGVVQQKLVSLGLVCNGMEFASEMVLRASQDEFRVAETPVCLHPDGRDRPPHIRSIRDGLRHLVLLCNRFWTKGGN